MNLLRPLLALLIIAGAIFAGTKFSEHHTGKNAFETLYMHLVPARLVTESAHADEQAGEHGGEHGDDHAAGHTGEGGEAPHFLLAINLPASMAFVDMAPEVEGAQLVMTNLQIFQIAAVLLLFVLFGGIPRYARTGQGDYLTRLFAGFAMWVRDDMVVPNMGKELGTRFLPWFLSLFFFILFMNVMGLVPGSATATSSIFVTCALALITLFSMILCGMGAQGPLAFWKSLVPHVPLALWPLMFVVELMGLFVKPFALMIRLFANMTGGHMVVLSFMGLIFFFAESQGSGVAWSISPIALIFAVFIMIIEAFVALLQAYVFTQLSIIFVGASVHPEH